MRVAVLGGTRFIGRAVVRELSGGGHRVVVVHRGEHEPPEDLPAVAHLHVSRRALRPEHLAGFDAVVDLCAMTGADAGIAIGAAPDRARLVVISSQDVYRACLSLLRGEHTDAVPIREEAPLRAAPLPLPPALPPGWDFEAARYEKIDVERAYLARGATVLRLPVTYGEHDYNRREEFVLRRVRAGRRRIPVGAGTLLWSRGYVGDLARGVRLALESDAPGEVFNLAEAQTWSVALWMRRIAEAAGAPLELVRVPDEALPPDLSLAASPSQHLLIDSSKARATLGYRDTDAEEALRRSVAWHLAHPPVEAAHDFSADDAALGVAARSGMD